MSDQSESNERQFKPINTNVLVIEGNIVKDSELRYTPNGKAVADFVVAVNCGQNPTIYVKCTIWEKRAEGLSQYLTKGRPVIVEGKLAPAEAWNDNDGNARAQLCMRPGDIQLLPNRNHGADGSEQEQPASAPEGEDIPF